MVASSPDFLLRLRELEELLCLLVELGRLFIYLFIYLLYIGCYWHFFVIHFYYNTLVLG